MKNHSWTPQIWFHPIPRRSIAIIPSLGWERLKTSEHRQNSGTWEFKDMIPSHSHIKSPHSMVPNSTKYLLSSASTMVSGCFRWMKGIHKDYHYHVEQNRSLRSELKLSLIMSSQLHRVLWLIHWQAFAGDEGVLARRDIVKNRQEQGNIVQLQCGLAILFALLETWPTVFHSINSPRLYLVYMYDDNPLGSCPLQCRSQTTRNSWTDPGKTSKATRAMGRVLFVVGEGKLIGNRWISY